MLKFNYSIESKTGGAHMKRSIANFYGCLMGGAIGDALGAPIEFMQYNEIVKRYGSEGVQELDIPATQRYALITDDTQLTLFTAEGLLRSETRARRKGQQRTLEGTTITVFRAYLRWLHTQGLDTPHWNKKDYDGWLIKIGKLHAYREPGVTCLTALGKGIMGRLEKPINDSKGCGGMMRVAPIGLVENAEEAFLLGMHSAAITHGNPSVYLSAGTLALLIHYVIEGDALEAAVQKALDALKKQPRNEEVVAAVETAIALTKEKKPSREQIEQLGNGFIAHEALAMAIYVVLSYPTDFEAALRLAVNHSGDSDSVGAIAGAILGAYLGIEAIPTRWVDGVELSREIEQLAKDLFKFYEEGEEWLKKYPAW